MGKSTNGRLTLTIDKNKIDKYLELNKIEIEQLTKFLDKAPRIKTNNPIPKINYYNLMNEFQSYLDRGLAKNRAELAKQLNVSRAWITIVFRRGSCDYKNCERLS